MAMKWNPLLTALNYRLAELYYTIPEERSIAMKAGLTVANITLVGNPVVDWFNILDYARLQDQVVDLVEVVISAGERGSRDEFLKGTIKLLREQKEPVEVPALDDGNWEQPESPDRLEKLMGSVSTLLPISFLEQGLQCSKAVVRIDAGKGLGTGFLVRDNYLITNNHVLPDKETARNAKIQFNYQTNWQGLTMNFETFMLNPDSDPKNFITNPDPKRDFTIVKLNGDANSSYGALTFSDIKPKRDDFVNIIQHPSGGPKQLALYHNIVKFADDTLVQYLTDTLPGSSGSPVFNSDWQVIALHHSGGWIKEPGLSQSVYRNEGINISKIQEAFESLIS